MQLECISDLSPFEKNKLIIEKLNLCILYYLSTECHGYNRAFRNTNPSAGLAGDANVWAGEPVKELFEAKLPDEFVVDYVRVFDAV